MENKQAILGNLAGIRLPIRNIVNDRLIETRYNMREKQYEVNVLTYNLGTGKTGIWLSRWEYHILADALDRHYRQVAIADMEKQQHACEYCGTDKMPTFWSRIRGRWLCRNCHDVQLVEND